MLHNKISDEFHSVYNGGKNFSNWSRFDRVVTEFSSPVFFRNDIVSSNVRTMLVVSVGSLQPDSCDCRFPDNSRVDALSSDVGLSPRARSAQDLTKQPAIPSPHHQSTDSLLEERPRGGLDRLRGQDASMLSRRQSFGGALHKAASAVVIRCRDIRDSLKAVSADLLTSSGSDANKAERDERTSTDQNQSAQSQSSRVFFVS